MKIKLSRRFNRAKYIYRKEGLIYLIIVVVYLLLSRYRLFEPYRFYFQAGDYYLYEYDMRKGNDIDFLSRMQNYIFKILTSKKQADELAANGFTLHDNITNVRKRLDKGATAFCIFVGGELANIGWVARTEEAKKSLDFLPYQVDFSNKHAWTGGVWTNPKYRGKGLYDYSGCKRIEFLREMGVRKVQTAVAISNSASIRGSTKHGYKTYAKGRYLRLLWWKSWKETPIESIMNVYQPTV